MEMEMECATPSTKRERLAPPATSSSSGALVVEGAGSGEGAPPRSEEECHPDRISDLPDVILGEIISRLSTKEGIHTQILAHQWRPLWCTAPLNLDCREISAAHLFNDGETVHIEIFSKLSVFTEERVHKCYFGTWRSQKFIADVVSLPESMLSDREGSVNRLSIPVCYLQCRPSTVDGWLQSSKVNNLQVLEFYYLFPLFMKQEITLLDACTSSTPSAPMSVFRFSSSLHTVAFALCQIPDNYVRALKLPLLKRLSLVEVDISDDSLQSIIHTSCPVLESLLLVCNSGGRCITINTRNLVSIGICYEEVELIIEDAPSLQRLIHDIKVDDFLITIISAPKLETLGEFVLAIVYTCLESEDLVETSVSTCGFTCIRGLWAFRLTPLRQSVKTLFICMSYIVDMVVPLLQFFLKLQNLFLEGGFVADGAINNWRRKHRTFVKEHDIHLKSVTFEDYESSGKNIEFVRFFILNAMELETIRIKYRFASNFTQEFYEQQEKLFQWENKVSKCAHLKLSACCEHTCLDLKDMHVEYLDLIDPFTCDCWKQGCS